MTVGVFNRYLMVGLVRWSLVDCVCL
jgi:hypothetical protein